MHTWFVLAHVLGAFLFMIAHGASMGAALKLRGEHDRGKVTQLLELSAGAVGVMYIGLLLLVAGGVAAGFSGDYWGKAWIWAAIGVLVVVLVAMYAIATPFYMGLRTALTPPAPDAKPSKRPPLTDVEVDAMLNSSRPFVLAGIGGIGILVILWLMVAKPF
jgi:hypothetical protein